LNLGIGQSNQAQPAAPLDLGGLKVLPLAQRRSLTRIEDILVQPDDAAPACSPKTAAIVSDCAQRIRQARQRMAPSFWFTGPTC